MAVSGGGPEIVFLTADGLEPLLDHAGAVHVILKAVNSLPASPNHAIFSGVIALAADIEKSAGHSAGIMAFFRGGPEIVLFAADGLPSGPDDTVAAHVVFVSIDSLPPGGHNTAFAEIVFILTDRGETRFSACFGIYIVDFAVNGDPACLFITFGVIEPLA